MKSNFWESNEQKKQQQQEQPIETTRREQKDYTQSSYECFWLPFTTAMKEVFPRYDSILCINEHGELAILELPESLISIARAKVVYEHANTDVAFIQHISHGKDESFLVPVIYTQKQVAKLDSLHSSFTRGNLKRELEKGSWPGLVSEVRTSSLPYQHQSSLLQPLKRAHVIGNEDPTKPDGLAVLEGCDNKIPVFIYTSPDEELELDMEQLHREMVVRGMLSQQLLKLIEDTVRKMPDAGDWHKDKGFMQVISRVEAELELNSEAARPPMAELLLNPQNTQLILEPEVTLKLTAEGERARQYLRERPLQSGFSISDWGDPNIAQVVLRVGERENMTSPQSVTSPAITIIKDELGIHTLPAYLFTVCTGIFDIGHTPDKTGWLDEVPASEIPEIQWQPATGDIPQVWWQVDTIARKILWLVTRNLYSHLVPEPLELTCSVTPIGEDAIQVAVVEGSREVGTPYAFAVMRGDLGVSGIPIFPTGTIKYHPDGSAEIELALLKNYTITREGERKQTKDLFTLLDRPIYSLVVSAKRKVQNRDKRKA